MSKEFPANTAHWQEFALYTFVTVMLLYSQNLFLLVIESHFYISNSRILFGVILPFLGFYFWICICLHWVSVNVEILENEAETPWSLELHIFDEAETMLNINLINRNQLAVTRSIFLRMGDTICDLTVFWSLKWIEFQLLFVKEVFH